MDVIGHIRYTKLEQIGIGEGMNSTVYRATDPHLNGEIAVKEIPKATFGNDPAAYFEEAQRMFASEHDNVVKIRCACETTDLIGLLMPYYVRGSLAKRIKDHPLGLGELLRIADGVMRGVIRIHSGGCLHFDLKPSNVLFSDLNQPMVADFGQARQFNRATGTVQAPNLYTHAFPPEMFDAPVGTVHSDIHQLGILLYRAANSDLYFKAQAPPVHLLPDLIKRGKFPDRKLFLPHVTPHLRTLIRRALKVRPEERFSSVTEFADALARLHPPLDWQATLSASGEITWRATRHEQPDLLVMLERDGTTAWQVRVYTDRPPSAPRAARKADCWRASLQRPEAFKFLDDVFRILEGG